MWVAVKLHFMGYLFLFLCTVTLPVDGKFVWDTTQKCSSTDEQFGDLSIHGNFGEGCIWQMSPPAEDVTAVFMHVTVTELACDEGYLKFYDKSGITCAICLTDDPSEFCQIYVKEDTCTEDEIWTKLYELYPRCVHAVIRKSLHNVSFKVVPENDTAYMDTSLEYQTYTCKGSNKPLVIPNMGPGPPTRMNSLPPSCSRLISESVSNEPDSHGEKNIPNDSATNTTDGVPDTLLANGLNINASFKGDRETTTEISQNVQTTMSTIQQGMQNTTTASSMTITKLITQAQRLTTIKYSDTTAPKTTQNQTQPVYSNAAMDDSSLAVSSNQTQPAAMQMTDSTRINSPTEKTIEWLMTSESGYTTMHKLQTTSTTPPVVLTNPQIAGIVLLGLLAIILIIIIMRECKLKRRKKREDERKMRENNEQCRTFL